MTQRMIGAAAGTQTDTDILLLPLFQLGFSSNVSWALWLNSQPGRSGASATPLAADAASNPPFNTLHCIVTLGPLVWWKV